MLLLCGLWLVLGGLAQSGLSGDLNAGSRVLNFLIRISANPADEIGATEKQGQGNFLSSLGRGLFIRD